MNETYNSTWIQFVRFSSKIREEDYRQIQTNVPFLAPEILAVFQNSQIFHDHQPSKSLAIVHKSPSHSDDARRQSLTNSATEKTLLKRLEGNIIKTKSNRTSKKWLTKLRFTIPIVWSGHLAPESSQTYCWPISLGGGVYVVELMNKSICFPNFTMHAHDKRTIAIANYCPCWLERRTYSSFDTHARNMLKKLFFNIYISRICLQFIGGGINGRLLFKWCSCARIRF